MSLKIIEEQLLLPNQIDINIIQKILHSIPRSQIDDADMYFQHTEDESWFLEDSSIKTGGYSIEQGVGVRVVSGEKTGFAFSTDLKLPQIQNAFYAARHIGQHKTNYNHLQNNNTNITPKYNANNPIYSIKNNDKLKILNFIDNYARGLDSRVTQVTATLNATFEMILINNIQGLALPDLRPLVSLNITITVSQNNRQESARSGGGGRGNYLDFYSEINLKKIVDEAVNEALINLEARPAPAGTMPVVLGSGWPGVLLHEAVGHGLEADFNRKGLSAFSNKLGQKVASKGVTVIDDGTIKNRRGSLTIDDEGTPTQKTVLIEDGILVNYMQDKLNARLMGMQPTGNCRRESYAHMPMPRMTNTFMIAGSHTKEEMIKSIKRGIYAVNFSGGQVDITSGQFVFSANHAYMIEDGKITYPVKGATLIGSGPDIMNKISMIGNDFKLDPGMGVCGKAGQSVPVGVGQPSLKIDAITVGGTAL